MNHKMNLKIALVSALLLGQSFALAAPTYFQATKFGSRLSAMDNDPAPIPLTPIRIAKGTLQIDRIETTWDAANNTTDMKATTICKQNYDVRVFDLRNHPSNYYYSPGDTTCKDTVNNQPIEIRAGSSLLIIDGLSQGMPTVKLHSAFAYLLQTGNTYQAIPYIRGQDSFTVDLSQVNFGAISIADSGVMCAIGEQPIGPTPVPVQPPNPNPHIKGTPPKNCTVVNPIAYQAIWMAEDVP